MGVVESVISVLGTLVGVLAGFLMSHYFESKRRKHEKEVEYRREIRKDMDDLIKPLFVFIQNLWGSLGLLQISLGKEKSVVHGKGLDDLLHEVQTANQIFQEFVRSKYDEMSLILPSPFPWIFAPLDELVRYKIIEPILQGNKPVDDMTVAINSLMKIQKDLRRIVGFEIDVKLESVYPFEETRPHEENSTEEKAQSKNESSNQNRKEEIRGLFVLGLLAVLSAIRIQNSEMLVEIGRISVDIIPWIDITILLWSLYAFFMVLGLSEDIIGKSISTSFRGAAGVFLGLNYAILILLSLLVFVSGFLPRIPYALFLLLILAFYLASVKLRKRGRPSKAKVRDWWESFQSNTPQMLMLVFALCVVLTIYTHEEYLIPSFITGCVAVVLYIVLKEKVKSE